MNGVGTGTISPPLMGIETSDQWSPTNSVKKSRLPSLANASPFAMRSFVSFEVRTILGCGSGALSNNASATTATTAAQAKTTLSGPRHGRALTARADSASRRKPFRSARISAACW